MSTLLSRIKGSQVAGFLRPYWRAWLSRKWEKQRISREREQFVMVDEDDQRRIEFYRQFISPNDLVFDVGANRGNRTKAFLNLGARVVAFEPQPSCADYLQMVLGPEKRFELVRSGLGPAAGTAEMMVSGTSVLSSFSARWIEATQRTGRFGTATWDERVMVEMTTLDRSIARHGKPAFTKIDVEGFELEVLSGLTQPLPCLSIEFTAEYIENTFAAIDRLASFGDIEIQLSYSEEMLFALPAWQGPQAAKEALSKVGPLAVGDIYVRSVRNQD